MKSKHPLSRLFILISACWLLIYNQSIQAAPELTIGNYQLVSSKRITRTVFEYTYKATITNTGVDASGVSAILSVSSPNITVVDSQLAFGDVSGGANKISQDDFTIRQDRQFSFSPNSLQWAVTAKLKPSEPQVIDIGNSVNTINVNTLLYDGEVDLRLPVGKTLDSLFVVSGVGGKVPVTTNGQFIARLNAKATGLLRVVDNDGNVYLLKLYPKEEGLAEENPVINAESTAIALLALKPGIISNDPYIDAVMFALLARLPEVKTLANLIDAGLANGTFRVNAQFSSEMLQAITNASNAIDNISAENLYISNYQDKLKTLIANWLDVVIKPAFAEINFEDACSDIFSGGFTGASGNKDGVCIGTELGNPGEISTFYMSNPKTRWVFFGIKESNNNIDFLDTIPPRHVSIPNIKTILVETTSDLFQSLSKIVFKGEDLSTFIYLYSERINKKFGPAKSNTSYAFQLDNNYELITVATTINSLSDYSISLGDEDRAFYGSMIMTFLTEGVMPFVSVVNDVDEIKNAFEKVNGKTIIACMRNNEKWITDTSTSFTTIMTSESNSFIKISEWFTKSFVLEPGAYQFLSCTVGNTFGDKFKNFLSDMPKLFKAVLGEGVDNLFFLYDKTAAILNAGINIYNMQDDFRDPMLVAVDYYKATIGNPNKAPDARDDSIIAQSGLPVSINVLANDTDADGETLNITVPTQSSNGVLTNNGTSITYKSNAGFVGTDTFTYTVSDGKASDTATVTVQVSAAPVVNSNPVAGGDIKTAESGVTTSIDVLANDSDADGDTLIITSVTQAANGSVTKNNNSVTYKSNAGFVGTDTFTYTVSDGAGTATATVTITVTASITSTTWSISPASVSVSEGDVTVSFIITRSNSTAAKEVFVSTVQDQGSTNNNDYLGKLNESLPFAAGQAQQPVTVTIKKDNVVEGNETFRLIVQESPTDPINISAASATFTIIDDGTLNPTSKLNDTGITTCSNGSTNNLPCPVSGYPGQDGEYGRDAMAKAGLLKKVGGGKAGFDFTKLDSNGNPLSANASAWHCVRDNVTGLIWEVKTTSGLRSMHNTYSWYEPDSSKNGGSAGTQNGGSCIGSSCDIKGYVQAVNGQGLCGSSDWRMPTRNELLSIVNNLTSSPVIDTSYFPNTPFDLFYWSSSPYANTSNLAWGLDFNSGPVNFYLKSKNYYVRLVRDGN